MASVRHPGDASEDSSGALEKHRTATHLGGLHLECGGRKMREFGLRAVGVERRVQSQRFAIWIGGHEIQALHRRK